MVKNMKFVEDFDLKDWD